MRIYLLIFINLALWFALLHSHGGRLNSEGCHLDKKKGIYHCHDRPKKKNSSKKSSKYQRKNWRHWIDRDGDCQNERQEILIKSSEVPVLFKTKKRCRVTDGLWYGVYTDQYYSNASQMDIDHLVPLKEAYLSGGREWSREEKKIFANDPENLISVEKSVNRKKGAKDPAQWLPPNDKYHCSYIFKWVKIKKKYRLKMDPKEKEFIHQKKGECLSKGVFY